MKESITAELSITQERTRWDEPAVLVSKLFTDGSAGNLYAAQESEEVPKVDGLIVPEGHVTAVGVDEEKLALYRRDRTGALPGEIPRLCHSKKRNRLGFRDRLFHLLSHTS